MEQLQMNVARLKSYASKLIVFPRRDAKPKKGFFADATADMLKSAAAKMQKTGTVMPMEKKKAEVEYAKITDADKKKKVYHSLRSLRTNAHYSGRRIKRKNDAEKAKE